MCIRDRANTGAITATTIALSADGGVQVPNDGNIGSAGATDAMQISSGGIVTFKDDEATGAMPGSLIRGEQSLQATA